MDSQKYFDLIRSASNDLVAGKTAAWAEEEDFSAALLVLLSEASSEIAADKLGRTVAPHFLCILSWSTEYVASPCRRLQMVTCTSQFLRTAGPGLHDPIDA